MSKLALSLLLLLIVPLASATCLTTIEENTIRNLASNTSLNGDLLVNIFERLCIGSATQETLNSFNSTLNTRLNTIENNTNARITTLDNSINNSQLVQTLTQVSQIYNQSVSIDNRIVQLESRMNTRIDNITLSALERQTKFESIVNQNLESNKTNNLSTNRIIIIGVLAVALIAGAVYYTRKRIIANIAIKSVPFDMRKEDTDESNNERKNNTYKTRRNSAK